MKPFATVQEIIKYFPWKRFNINLPQILAILEGWPIDVPSPTSGLGGPKDKGINDLKDAELKSLITSLRERRLSARFCTTAEAGGKSIFTFGCLLFIFP